MRRTLCGLLVLLAVAGCREAERDPDRAMSINDIPPAALAAAKRKLPDVTFEAAWAEHEGGPFEIRGRNRKGKVRDVKVSATGEVLEVD